MPAGPTPAHALHNSNNCRPQELLPGYRAVVEEYFEAVRGLGMRLLRLLALSLELPADYFASSFTHPILSLRPLHYRRGMAGTSQGNWAFGRGLCGLCLGC